MNVINKCLKKYLKNPKILGNLAYFVANIIHKTLRIKVIASPKYNANTPYLFAFWHGKQFLPIIELKHHKTKKVALVSPSKDGQILEVLLHNIESYEVDRGSSRSDNIKSLVRLVKRLKAGYSVGFGVDGPIGPIYKVKPGMTYMSQKCGVAIVPLASSSSAKWIFEQAWDKYEIPKPFAKVIYCIGEPYYIDANADLEKCNLELEKKLNDLQLIAQMELCKKN